jgi:WD40 repeat protein/anti-sigma factor RsiW
MAELDCIPEADLQAFVLGELPERPADAIAHHLARCPACEARAGRLDELADSAIQALRQPASDPAAPARTSLNAGPAGEGEAAPTPTTGPAAVPGYEVLGELGRGGMGVVYRARQTSLDRIVALKMLLSAEHAGPQELARFRTEAEALARLQHPNLVQIYDVGHQDGLPYFSLEYCGGGSLAAKLDGTPLPPRPAAELAETLARAMHAAHQQGIVHRDLKPANVLLTADGTPKITDFGLAKRLDGEPGQTASGAVMGTPSYMAPEQAGGKSGKVGPAADVYALGAILYELLTGRPPFKAATPLDTVLQVLSDEPVPPRGLQPKLPRDLETICLKCLEKAPQRRYPSAAELADDLGRFLAHRPVRARRTSAPERLWRWTRRHPGWATAALLLILLAGGATAAAVALQAQLTRAKEAEAGKTEQLWEARFAQAWAIRLGRHPGQRFKSLALLEDLARERPDPRLRDEMAACYALPDLHVVRRWTIDPPGAQPVDVCAFDRDQRLYARLDRAGGLTVHRVADGTLVRRLPGQFQAPVLSPDGRYLAAARRGTGGTLLVWRLDSEQPVIDAAADGPPNGVDFTPDSRTVLSAGPNGTVTVRGLDGAPPVRLACGRLRTDWFAAHPDGKRFAVAVVSPGSWRPVLRAPRPVAVQVRDLKTGDVKAELPVSWFVSGLAWHPGGELLAVCRDYNDGGVLLWDVAAKQSRYLACDIGVTRAAFSRAGDLLVTADRKGRLSLWEPATGRLLMTIPARCLDLRFGSDGLLACGFDDGQAVLWEVGPAPAYRTLRHPNPDRNRNGYNCCALDPEDRLLAVGGSGGIDLWDIDTGRLRGTLPLKSVCTDLAFEGPGALLSIEGGIASRWQLGPVARAGRAADGRLPAAGEPLDLPAGQVYVYRGIKTSGTTWAKSVAASRTGGVTAVFTVDHKVFAFHRGSLRQRVLLGSHVYGINVALSHDGLLAATGGQPGTGVKVWDTKRGALVKELPNDEPCRVGFSADSRWLLTTAGGCRLWDTATWKPGPVLGGNAFAFAADPTWKPGLVRGGTAFAFAANAPRLLAVETGKGVVRLLDPVTGGDYVRLEDPDRDVAAQLVLSTDGGRLIAMSHESRSIHIWDLRAIRRRLDASGLAGDWPAAPK